MAARIEKEFSAETELIASSGGVFEVVADGELVFSKKQTGERPDEDQIIATIGSR